jgi:hypothetical protein
MARAAALGAATTPAAFRGVCYVISALISGPPLTDALEKGFSRVALTISARNGFLHPPLERKGDSRIAPHGTQILSDHCIISNKSDFFDSIATKLPSMTNRHWHKMCMPSLGVARE